ncbi:hypothetical protein AB0425_17895 [Actinosynnema sp. NPDC051121]
MAEAEPETLQDLFRRRQAELGDLTVRQVWQRAEGRAGYETFRRIENGSHTRITDQVIDALAHALAVPESTVLKAAGQRPRLGPFEPPRRWERLTESERAALLTIADAILNAREAEEDQPPVQLRLATEQADEAPQRKRAARAAHRRRGTP